MPSSKPLSPYQCHLIFMMLHPHFLLFFNPAFCAVNIVIQLSPISSQTFPQLPHSTHSPPPSQVTQRCPSLSTGQCCVPIDLSEVSLTESRQRYQPTALDFRLATTPSTPRNSINICTQRDCDGPAVARVPLAPASQGGASWDVKAGVRVSGVGIDEEAVGKREVRYPSSVKYQGGLYYEYQGGSLVYARVSYWGEGPNTIYGMRQGVVDRAASRARNGTGSLNESAAGPMVDTAR